MACLANHPSTFRTLLWRYPAISSLLVVWVAISVSRISAESPAKSPLQQQIADCQAIAAKAAPPAMSPVDAGRIWTHLGTLYQDAGQYAQSEMAYLHALRLLDLAPASAIDRARAMDDLGTLYMARGDTQQAERAELHALQIRKDEGLTAELASSYDHLAALSLHEHRTKKAQEYAQQALDALDAEPHSNPADAINAQFVLAVAHLRMNHYPEAIAILEKTMRSVHTLYRPEDFSTGFGSFLLGYAYWKAGDVARADSLLKEGADTVEKQLGNDHPVTLTVLTQYKGYLRATNQRDAARAIDQQLKRSRSEMGLGQGPETLAVASLF